MKLRSTDTADAIDALLPQTQCRQCGYLGCLPYAEAIAAKRAAINQCPPGGEATIRALAELLDVPFEPLDPAFGVIKPPQVAMIDETTCIGCTLCIQACPVDAIVGAPKFMHTVIASECTGCELCVLPCPVDCILMKETTRAIPSPERAAHAKRRYLARRSRLARESAARAARLAAARDDSAERRKRETIERVMQRARERLRNR